MFSKKPYKRSERLSDHVRSILAGIFISDFHIDDSGLMTVTKVKVSSDLRLAKVFISLLAPKKQPNDIIKTLKINKKLIRFHLGNKLNTKFVPDLEFHYDDSLKKAEKIGRLLNEIEKPSKENL